MTTSFLAPDPVQSTFFIPGGNTPGNGAQVFFYVAGSVSTKQTAFKDNAAAVAWPNPIVLDSGGNLPAGGEVWFPTGQNFKVVWAPSNDTDPPVSPYRTMDNLSGMNDPATFTAASEWVSGPAPTFVSTTSFTLVGDQTAVFTKGRRVKTTNTAGTVYSTIISSVFGALTTVTIVNDGVGVLDAGLSAVSYGLLDPSLTSITAYEINKKGSNVASLGGGTTGIWDISGDYVHITGTNQIVNFSTSPYTGAHRDIVFDGILTLASSASLTLPFGNVTTAANDSISVRADSISTATVIQAQMATGVLGTSLQLLASLAVVNSSVANFGTSNALAMTSFAELELHIINLVSSAQSSFAQLRLSTSGAASFITTGVYHSAGNFLNSNASTISGAGENQAVIAISDTTDGINNGVNSVGSRYNAVIKMYSFGDSVSAKNVQALINYQGSRNFIVDGRITGGIGTMIAPVNGIQCSTNGGVISTATFNLYGVKAS